jgi:hypothetical protein
MRSMTASPIVFTQQAPAGSSAFTASQKSATKIAASSSPCASVSAVKPARSANRKVAAESLGAGSSYSSTLKLNIMPLSWCSAMWQ